MSKPDPNETELDDLYQPGEEELDAYYRSLDWFTIDADTVEVEGPDLNERRMG